MFWQGLRILSNPLATTTRHKVARWPGRKRRKKWHVAKEVVPGCFQIAGGTLVMHPVMVEKLKAQVANGRT